jgi:hypothetical protein
MSRGLRQVGRRDEEGLLLVRFAFAHRHEKPPCGDESKLAPRGKRFQWISRNTLTKTTGCLDVGARLALRQEQSVPTLAALKDKLSGGRINCCPSIRWPRRQRTR